MIKLQLLGVLGERFGASFTLDVSTPAEAMYALSKTKDGFESFLRNNNFHFWVDERNITLEETALTLDASNTPTVLVALCVEGAGGNGALAIIAGVALVIGGFFMPAAWGAAAKMFAIGFGAALMASGVGTMLMPKMGTVSGDEEGNRASYGFGGAVTTVAQGNVVPVAFGQCWRGGFVITYRITSERVA